MIAYFYGAFESSFKHKGSSQHLLSKELKLVQYILTNFQFCVLWKKERIESKKELNFYFIFSYFVTLYGTFAKILPSFLCVFALSLYRVQNHLFFLIAQQRQLDNTSTPLQPKGLISCSKSSLNSTATTFYFPRLSQLDQLVLSKDFCSLPFVFSYILQARLSKTYSAFNVYFRVYILSIYV